MILGDFNNQKDEDKSRGEYLADLAKLFCKLYGYNEELMSLLQNIFSPHEVIIFHLSYSYFYPQWKRRDLSQ